MSTPAAAAGAFAQRPARWRVAGWALAAFAIAVTLLVLLAYAIEEPMRRRLEQTLNEQLKGYRVRIEHLDLQPHDVGLALRGVTVQQERHPSPPVLRLDAFEVGLQWRALLRGAVVADVHLLSPRLHVDREQLAAEARDDVAVEEKGWQQAVQSIYPLEINHFEIIDGAATYLERRGARPVRISDAALEMTNVRNVADPDDPYPSTFQLRAAVFDDGVLRADGRANFLSEPQPTVRMDIELERVPLERLRPVADDVHLRIRGGTLTAHGAVETTPEQQRVTLGEVRLAGVQVDYRRTEAARAAEAERAQRVEKAASAAAGAPTTTLRLETLHLEDLTLGYIDETADPTYRVFVDGLGGELRDVRVGGGATEPAQLELRGRFMGSGPLHLEAQFVPRETNPDFTMALQIHPTELRTMNDLLRAYGNIDVTAGTFSFYSDIAVRDGRIDGYVKPLFREMDVYDSEQDADEGLLQQAYEGIAGGIANLLENPSDRVATQTDISGRTEAPDVSIWQVLFNLVRNAFFQSILPGLERSGGGGE